MAVALAAMAGLLAVAGNEAWGMFLFLAFIAWAMEQ